MRRTAFIAAGLAAATAGSSALAAGAGGLVAGSGGEAEFDLSTPSGTIAGTLLLPAVPGPMAVALIVPGSGPIDRDGNAPGLKLDIYRKLAAALAAAGVASVRYDKRGVAASSAALTAESDIRFEMGVDDAAAWVAKLRADPRFAHIVIVGHSEGSLTGMLAAPRSAPTAFVSVDGAGFPAATLLHDQLAPRLAGYPTLAAQIQSILDALSHGKTVAQADVPPALQAIFRPSVQPYLISWFKYDPRVEIANVAIPVTIVQGGHDVQVPPANGRALAAAARNAGFVLIDDMTHVLTDDPGTTLAQQQDGAYADASRPIDAELVKTIVSAATPA